MNRILRILMQIYFLIPTYYHPNCLGGFSFSVVQSTIMLPEHDITCPITHERYVDPVVLEGDGFTYERSAIERWLKNHSTSPITGAPIKRIGLIPNYLVRQITDSVKDSKTTDDVGHVPIRNNLFPPPEQNATEEEHCCRVAVIDDSEDPRAKDEGTAVVIKNCGLKRIKNLLLYVSILALAITIMVQSKVLTLDKSGLHIGPGADSPSHPGGGGDLSHPGGGGDPSHPGGGGDPSHPGGGGYPSHPGGGGDPSYPGGGGDLSHPGDTDFNDDHAGLPEDFYTNPPSPDWTPPTSDVHHPVDDQDEHYFPCHHSCSTCMGAGQHDCITCDPSYPFFMHNGPEVHDSSGYCAECIDDFQCSPYHSVCRNNFCVPVDQVDEVDRIDQIDRTDQIDQVEEDNSIGCHDSCATCNGPGPLQCLTCVPAFPHFISQHMYPYHYDPVGSADYGGCFECVQDYDCQSANSPVPRMGCRDNRCVDLWA